MDPEVLIRETEIQHKRKDGSLFWISFTAHVIRDREDKVLYYEGRAIDITDRKKAEEGVKEGIHKLQQALQGVIQVLVMTVEQRDPYTAGHQQRVGDLAGAIAEELGLAAEESEKIRLAGMIHDIGKISVPAEILSKPGILSREEILLIREHPETAAMILKDAPFPWNIAEVVLQHHERMDGSGYPKGLQGAEILFMSHILAVADVVEAMSSHRPYRPALGIDAALEEILNYRGIRFDMEVVDACIRLFREKGYRLETS